MTKQRAISIDIGSTFTKGGLFDLDQHTPSVLKTAHTPTTTNDLTIGFTRVLAALTECPPETPLQNIALETEVHVSSSAKGGLAIAAVGLVPDLTLQVAKLAAYSAGGKVVCSFAYGLTADDVTRIEHISPDILLLCGGTDGGNTSYVLQNAKHLVHAEIGCPIIYAGNRDVADQVAQLLGNYKVTVVPNLMPELGELNLEPVRDCIRKIFLELIIDGKGLSRIVAHCGCQIRPTPLGVFELIEIIPRVEPGYDNLCVLDVGGATTDFYSNTESAMTSDTVVLKGIREPRLKRSVEGDLGLRVSIKFLRETAAEYIEAAVQREQITVAEMDEYVARCASKPDYVADTLNEQRLDAILFEACAYHAALRHAGIWKPTFTPAGKIYVQKGKDLRQIKRIVGTGGYIAHHNCADAISNAFWNLSRPAEKIILAPTLFQWMEDKSGLFPLLGNLAQKYPEVATKLAIGSLTEAIETKIT